MYRRIDGFSFIFGLIILGPVVLLGLLINRGFFDFVHGMQLCSFHKYTGWYCPGCGLTRSCFALFMGHPVKSLLYHILPISAIVIYLVYMVYLFYLRNILKSRGLSLEREYPEDIEAKNRRFHKRLEIAVYIVVGMILLQWIIRDILLIAYDFDWFTLLSER